MLACVKLSVDAVPYAVQSNKAELLYLQKAVQ